MPPDYYTGEASTRFRLEREERDRAGAARRAVFGAAIGPALQRAEAGNVEGMREVIQLLADRHRIRVEVREEMPSGAGAFSIWRTRTIVIPPIVDAKTFAVALHEAGHVLAGECTGREPHRPDPSVTRWHHCIACETDAWIEALKLAPFSREMFAELQRCLRAYRGMTPAAQAEIDRLDRTAGTVTWATERQKRQRWAWMVERLERARRS